MNYVYCNIYVINTSKKAIHSIEIELWDSGNAISFGRNWKQYFAHCISYFSMNLINSRALII